MASKNGSTVDNAALAILRSAGNLDAIAEMEIESILDIARHDVASKPSFGAIVPDGVNTTDEYIWKDFPFVPDASGRATRAAYAMVSALARANDNRPQGYLTYVTSDGKVVKDKMFRCLARENASADVFDFTVRLLLLEYTTAHDGSTVLSKAETTIAAHQIRNIRRKVRNPYFDRGDALGFDVDDVFSA